ncbi:DUF3558 family protein [Gordonia sp. DT30]|uniref:DUF3558 family protein n=1 Tax=unclassified Gordonia (in: high G+C Gram-positive bacteria) TaxID=2657482 RepID=UPI003CF5378D
MRLRATLKPNAAKCLIVAVVSAPLFATILSCSRTAEFQSPTQTSLASHSATTSTRQTDSDGKPLPFKTKFPNRWNSNNDGTTYEPCTAVTSAILERFSLNPYSVTDAAIADHQTARGCDWTFREDRSAGIYQSLGNAPTLDDYKTSKSSVIDWLADTKIDNRRVAVGILRDEDCSTYVQSGSAVIVTSVSIVINPPPIDQLCAKAIAFTEATIDKMPP